MGCPTWPECTPGSYTPLPNQIEGQLHSWIEFGNRLLTFVLVLSSLIVIVAVEKSKRKDLRILAWTQLIGIFGQGILGGITVLTDLNPIPVAGHMLLSMLLISGATSLYYYSKYSLTKMDVDPLTKLIAQSHIVLSFVVIVLGTIVTGSGPHAGDYQARRFGFQVPTVAWIHAYSVISLVIISLILFIKSNQRTRKVFRFFGVVVVAQGTIGFFQYYQGVPELLVGAHLLGASLFWIATWRIWLTLNTKNG